VDELLRLSPPAGAIPAGEFGVDLSVEHFEDGDQVVAAARVRFTEKPVVRWQRDPMEPEVHTGTVVFAEAAAAKGLQSEEGAEALQSTLAGTEEGIFSATRTTVQGAVVFVVALGSTDGMYSVWWGYDASGAVAALVVDFEVLVEPITVDLELTPPLPRGPLNQPELAAHGVRAWVPMLSPSKLLYEVNNGRHSLLAHWRLPDGSLQRLPFALRARNRRELTLRPVPPDARLLLRVITGSRPLRPRE
jgi:hypothetical protein